MPYSIRKNTLRSPAGRWAALVALAVLVIAGAAPAAADRDDYYDDEYGSGDTAGYDTSYSYVRTLEGSATLVQGDTQDRDDLQVNQPILVGDRIWVAPNGRVEVVLSDRNLLRIDGGSEVVFDALASSPDRDDPSTILRLPEGNLQLVVEGDFIGDDYPRIDTSNATVYANQTGTYRITADEGWSEVLARDGAAEVVTREGSVIVRQGEEAVIEGVDRPRTQVRRASREDSLEIWGERLDREGRYASTYVDDSIAYEAAHLDRYGSWDRVDGRYAWRPRVSVEWRPYWNGRWRFSSLGMTWVSYEPWGWVPYHYGTWDYLPGHGWLWFPGHRFSPAWVYWNWTDHYAGWVPIGYYSRYYWSSYGRYGLRAGVYGYAGGHWDHYRYWNFCDLRYFGHRYQYRHHGHGDRFGRQHRYAVPKRGILTTDTRGITRTAVQRGEGIERILVDRGTRGGRDLADVTPFVERRRELPDDVRGRVVVDRGDGARDAAVRRPARLAGTGGVPGAGDRPTRAAATETRSPRRVIEREAPGTAGIERSERAIPARSARPEAAADRSPDRSPDRSAAPRATPSRDWREREARPRREPPARIDGSERGDASPARGERVSPNEVRRRPGVRESESDRSSITRRVVEGVRSNERSNDRRAEPSRTERPSPPPRAERASPPPRTERQSPPSRTERQSPPPRVERESPPPARERSGSASRSSSSRRESARPSRRESPPPRSSQSVRPTRSRTSSPPARAESSRPSSRASRPSSRPSPSRARSAPSRPSRPSASTRSSSRPSRSSSNARSSRPSRSPSRATSSRSSRSSSKARSSRPSGSPSRAKSSRPSRSSSRASQPSRSRAPSRSKARRGKPPTL